jgi:S1-C subfamily serine protease
MEEIARSSHYNLLAVGNPDMFKSTLTRGIISATEQNLGGSPYMQFDAKVAHGNSGGPLLNSKYEVVGVVARNSGIDLPEAEGYNFAIPVRLLRSELQRIAAGR